MRCQLSFQSDEQSVHFDEQLLPFFHNFRPRDKLHNFPSGEGEGGGEDWNGVRHLLNELFFEFRKLR
uniref:Uncharacterized protein n=1 Tax=Caenorhabditis tropicalis TaxID=1561998 RepID=A0A1I7TTE0_9PELO